MQPFTSSLTRWTATILLFSLCFSACRKTDRAAQETEVIAQDYTQLKKRFFNASAADLEVQKLAADLQRQDSPFKFLPDFVSKNGIPKWEKAIYKVKGHTSASGRAAQRNASDSGEQGLFFVPLQAQNSTQIQSYIAAYKTGDSTYSYKLFNKDSLVATSPQSGETKRAMVNALGVLAFFEKSINNQLTSQYNISNNEVVEFKNPSITITDTATSSINGGRSTTANRSLNCNFTLTITETYTEINVYVSGELVYHYESYSVSVVLVVQGDCSGGGGGGGYDPWGSPSNNWYNWGTGYNYDPYWDNYNYNLWLYPWWTSFIGGGSGGGPVGLGFPYDFNFFNLYNGSGGKPISEYHDTAKCQGIQDIWNNYTNNEVLSFVTADGKLIVTDVLPLNGGATRGLYKYNDPASNTTKYYYTYPISQGAPSQSHAGMVNNGQYYFIPVVASVHTHTPCRTDGTNGVSHQVGSDDQALADNHPGLRNWVIGCGAIAQFDGSNSNFFNVQTGSLSSLCDNIN